MICRITVLAAMVLLAGCSNLGYYAQAVSGQVDILSRRQPLASMLADPATPAELASRLSRVAGMRDFAATDLALAHDGSYRSYADVGRDFVV